MSGRNAGLQVLVRKKIPHVIWTQFMLHRQALASRKMSMEIQIVFKAVARFVNLVRNCPFIESAKFCDDM
jgi:uncharacterized protein with HEPN domain